MRRIFTALGIVLLLKANQAHATVVWWTWIYCNGKSTWENIDTYDTLSECKAAGEADKAARMAQFGSSGSITPGCVYMGFKCLPPNIKPWPKSSKF